MTSLNGLPTITTFTGKLFNFMEPDPDSICLEDIAHGLAYENRFANQGVCHYSVAQHSILVERYLYPIKRLPTKDALASVDDVDELLFHLDLMGQEIRGQAPIKDAWAHADDIDLRRIALLHDATEAYLGDMAKPLKRMIPEYQAIETKVHHAIARRFHLAALDLPEEVKDADARLFAAEWPSFMKPVISDAKLPFDPAIGLIQAWSAEKAEIQFTKRFKELFGENA